MANGVKQEVNTDENRVPAYVLPDSLKTGDGAPVADAETWQRVRHPELLTLFRRQVYGCPPEAEYQMRSEIVAEDEAALEGTAVRREVRVTWSTGLGEHSMDILLYCPSRAVGPVPAFLGLNFYGNHTIHTDPGITLSTRWMRSGENKELVNHRATESSRGTAAADWPVDMILGRGYALAAVYYGDLVPDHPGGLEEGVPRLFRTADQPRAAEEWGAIGAWAWGLSRAMDILESDPQIDCGRVAVIGHSRLGKTALWAGANDPRFALVISNNSGCGGAALSRRRFGETVRRINTTFPHWFCLNFHRFNDREDALPVDQHQLLALMAPRPVYVASATEDLWADPRGEFLAAKHAESVYRLFGRDGLGVDEPPAPGRSVGGSIGYHLRKGGHGLTAEDWAHYLDFADRWLISNRTA